MSALKAKRLRFYVLAFVSCAFAALVGATEKSTDGQVLCGLFLVVSFVYGWAASLDDDTISKWSK